MHDSDTNPLRKRIHTSATTTFLNGSCMVTQVIINLSQAGSNSWALTLQDALSPPTEWISNYALTTLSNSGPAIFKWDSPIYFQDGVFAKTTGNAPGVVFVSVSIIDKNATGGG